MAARYTRKNLPPGEEVQYEGRPSRIAVLAKPVFGMLVALALFAWIAARQNSQGHTTLTTILSLGFILDVIVSAVGFLRAYTRYKSAEYVVTDRRVVGKYGFLRTSSVDVLMTQISGITVSQGWLGRIFGYGAVCINGTGTRRLLDDLKNPRSFQAAVHQVLEGSRLLKGTAAYTLDVRAVDQVAAPAVPASQPAAAGLFCSACGNAQPPQAAFCHGCGAAVPSLPQV